MITDQLKQFLISKDEVSELAFHKLVELLENSKFEFVDCGLINIYGLAVDKKGYYDITSLDTLDNQMIYFIILHEYCHVLRINKMTKGVMIKELSNTNIDELSAHIIYEECVADRYASLMYYRLNNLEFPRYRTQRLFIESIQKLYVSEIISNLHLHITDEESYDKMVQSVIKGNWIDINIDQPQWYENVDIKTNEIIKQDYHRVTDGETIYYGTLKGNSIIYEDDVSHWR